MRRTPIIAILVLAAASVLAFGCSGSSSGGSSPGGGGGASAATNTVPQTTLPADPSRFCQDIATVKLRGQELSEVNLLSASDIPQTKLGVSKLIVALDQFAEDAPSSIHSDAQQLKSLTDRIGTEVQGATTVDQLQVAVPRLITVLAQQTHVTASVATPVIEYVIKHCPGD
jgi:hypothetical protein